MSLPENISGCPHPDDMAWYFKSIKNHEILSRDQEKMLALSFQQAGNLDAGHRLVKANLRLVVKITSSLHTRSISYSLSDMIQQGNMGLMYAARKYNVHKKTKFSYYASFWIKAFIYQYLMHNYSSIKIGKTQAQRKLFFNLRKTKEQLSRNGRQPTPEQIAGTVGVKIEEVQEMEYRLANRECSLDAPFCTGAQEQFVDHLREIDSPSMEEVLGRNQMIQLIRRLLTEFKPSLDSRELQILEQRIMAAEPVTLQKLGDRFGISRERVRQLESSIIAKLREYFKAAVPDFQRYMSS